MATSRICSVDDCDKPAKARGWCVAHLRRWSIHGDPLADKPLRTSPGEATKFYREVVLEYGGDGCLVWPHHRNKDGYARLGEGLVHRMACEEVNGPPPSSGYDAAHSCGNGRGGCVNKRHVRWATRLENEADKIKHNTLTYGERNGCAKLTEKDVRAIRELVSVMSHKEIALRYGVSRHHVGRVLSGSRWSHIH